MAAMAMLLGGLGAILGGPLTAEPAAAASCGPAPAGKVAVMVVIDRGAGSVQQRCVTVDQGKTGMDALLAADPGVRHEGGFVCGILGVPTTGCAKNQSPDVPSWWYWHASPGGTWTYSQVGAPWHRLPERCAVEGWRYARPDTERTPRVAPPQVTCEAPPPVTRPPSSSAPTPAPPKPGSGGGGAPRAGGGATSPRERPPATSAPSRDRTSPSTTSPGEPSGEGGPTSTATPDRPEGDAPQVEVRESQEDRTADDGERRPGARGVEQGSDEVGAGDEVAAQVDDDRGGAPWAGTVVVVLLIAVLGGGALLRAKRR